MAIDAADTPLAVTGMVARWGRLNRDSLRLQFETGKVTALGTSAAKQTQLLPSVPPIANTVPGFDWEAWQGIVAPAGTPKDVVAKLNTEFNKGLAQPDIKKKINDAGKVVPGAPGNRSSTVSRLWVTEGRKYFAAFRSRDISREWWFGIVLDGIELALPGQIDPNGGTPGRVLHGIIEQVPEGAGHEHQRHRRLEGHGQPDPCGGPNADILVQPPHRQL